MLFWILVILIAVGVLSPYIAVVIKRRKMLRRIVSVASENGYRVRHLHKFVCFSPNGGGKYDLLIQNKTHAYPVKLWSTAKRSSTLIIKRSGRYYETYGVEEPMKIHKVREHTVKGFERMVRPTEENYKVKQGKTVTPVLLFYPCNRSAFADLGDSRRKIEFGDKIFKKTLCTPTMLQKMLLENAVPQAKIGANDKMKLENGVKQGRF